jgi:hypothetical protein
MARRLTAIAISMVALSVSGCFPTSDDGTGGMAPVPCGGTCVTTPEAPAAADNAPWGLYKAIRLDYDYSAAVRIFVGQDDPMTTSTCEGRAGSHEVTCSPKYTDHNDLYISFSFFDDPDMLWYPGTISLSMEANGRIYGNYMARKEKSTSLVALFEGGFDGTKKAACGGVVQDNVLTMCCSAIAANVNAACFQSTIGGDGTVAGTSCVETSLGVAPCPVPTTYTGGDTTFEGTLSGEVLTGTWTNETGSGTFELVRTM